MKAFEYVQPGIDTPEYNSKLKYQNKTMGASSVATLLGFSPFKTVYELCGDYQDEVSTFVPTIKTEMGHVVEEFIANKAYDYILDRYEYLFHDCVVSVYDSKGAEYKSLNNPHLTTNFDIILNDETNNLYIPLEIKYSNQYHKPGKLSFINDYLYTQIQVQMYVADAPFGFTAQYHQDEGLSVHLIKRDEAFIQKMLGTVNMFFDNNYSFDFEYHYFTKEQITTEMDITMIELNEAIIKELELKKEYEALKKKNDALIKQVVDYDNNFKLPNITVSTKEVTKSTINNTNDLIKEIINQNLLNDFDKLEIKVNVAELENKAPELYNTFITNEVEEKTTVRRNK